MGVTNFDLVQANAFLGSQFLTQGKTWNLKPYTGVDGAGRGVSPQKAFKTLLAAQTAARADQNDVVNMFAESNSASKTTDYQAATLAWAKDGVHLIGQNARQSFAQRSRVAWVSTYATASNLFTLSANGCLIANVEFYAGVDGSALPTGGLNVTGSRNHFINCQISGMGGAAGINDIVGAYALRLAGSENLFEDCVIGLDTITLGAAANSQILMAGAAARNIFRRCKILTYTNHATNNVFLRAATSSIDRFVIFEDCQFINPIDAGSTNLTQGMVVAPDAGGSVLLLGNTGFVGATDWNSTDAGNVRAINGTVTAGTFGLGVAVTR